MPGDPLTGAPSMYQAGTRGHQDRNDIGVDGTEFDLSGAYAEWDQLNWRGRKGVGEKPYQMQLIVDRSLLECEGLPRRLPV